MKSWFMKILKTCCSIIVSSFSKFMEWIAVKIEAKEFSAVHATCFVITIINLIIASQLPSIAIVTILPIDIVTVCLYGWMLVKIIKDKRDKENYFNNMSFWWVLVFFYLIAHSVLPLKVNPTLLNIFTLTFFIAVYYKARFLLLHYINHWKKYILLFFTMPFIAVFAYSLIGYFLFEVTRIELFIKDNTLLWISLFLSILLINLVVYWTPYERLPEVKVAIYLLLAIFSTLSYCFFISDYLAAIITNNDVIKVDSSVVSKYIEDFIKTVSLPYLVGSVFACFSIEKVIRDRVMSENDCTSDNSVFPKSEKI